jgi:chaperonin GroES
MARKPKSSKASIQGLDNEATSISKKSRATTTINEDGSTTVDLDPPEQLGSSEEKEHYENLIDQLDQEQKIQLGRLITDSVEADDRSRADWLRTIEMGLDLTGVKLEEKSEPFEGACSAQHPLLMEAAVKFQSKASNELLPATGPVKTFVKGDNTIEKEQQANRVKAHMNYQILEEMTEFYPDSERMLLYVALMGSGFKKTYYNAQLKRPCSEFIPSDQFIVPNSAPDLFRADRYTHVLYKNQYELDECFASGMYSKPEQGLGLPSTMTPSPVQKKTQELIGISTSQSNRDKVYTLYECYIDLHIEGVDEKVDGFSLASPYIVTVDKQSRLPIGLRRNWKPDDETRQKKVPFSHFLFVPSFNFYGFGFLHLLGNLQLTLTSAMRSLVDAGQFANLQGGFKLKGVRIVDDGSPISPGQFKDIESILQDVNKAIMPLPFKEPSNVLFEMLQFLAASGQKFADSTEAVIADSANYGPVGTTMALLDASTKFFSAIHKRLHSALKHELKTIAEINGETLEDNTSYNIQGETMNISRADYAPIVAVIPVSDPNISSNAHRMAKAQTILQAAQQAPQLHDMREIYRQFYVAMDFVNVDKIMPSPSQAQPNDPMSDISSAQQGQPIKAFPGQDHKSHIAIKQAFMTDPSTGGNPMMQKVSAQLQANVQEHMVLQFTEQVQAQMQLSAGGQGASSGSAQQGQQGQQPNGQGQGIPPQQSQGIQQGAAPQQPQQDPQIQAMAEAAKQVAMMNQQNLQNQLEQQKQGGPKDQAALMTAQARMADTHIKAGKAKFEEKYKSDEIGLKKAKLGLDHLKEIHKSNDKAKDRQAKQEQIVTTKGLDAMIQGQSHAFTAKQDQMANIQKAQQERATNEHSNELQKSLASHQASLQPSPSQTDGSVQD